MRLDRPADTSSGPGEAVAAGDPGEPARAVLGDAPPGLSDDQRDFALVFELLGFRRPQNRRVVGDE